MAFHFAFREWLCFCKCAFEQSSPSVPGAFVLHGDIWDLPLNSFSQSTLLFYSELPST